MLPEVSFHFPVLDELHYILLQQNETANIARGDDPPGGTPSTWQSQKTVQGFIYRSCCCDWLGYFLPVMNQFRKVVAGSWLAHVVGFLPKFKCLEWRQEQAAPRLHSHYPLLVGPDLECSISTLRPSATNTPYNHFLPSRKSRKWRSPGGGPVTGRTGRGDGPVTTARQGRVGRGRHVAVEEVRQVISVLETPSASLVAVSVHLVDEVTLPLSLSPRSPLPPLPPPPLLVLPPVLLRELRTSWLHDWSLCCHVTVRLSPQSEHYCRNCHPKGGNSQPATPARPVVPSPGRASHWSGRANLVSDWWSEQLPCKHESVSPGVSADILHCLGEEGNYWARVTHCPAWRHSELTGLTCDTPDTGSDHTTELWATPELGWDWVWPGLPVTAQAPPLPPLSVILPT